MEFFLLLVILTTCAATPPEDLSGKMFTFPQKTNTAHVRLNTSIEDLNAATVCLRSFTDILDRAYAIFSLSTPTYSDGFLIYKDLHRNEIQLSIMKRGVDFYKQDYIHNTWQSICATWESQSGLGQLWLDGKPSSRKFFRSGSTIAGNIITTLGQEQDKYGGGFNYEESFVGMLSDVHMWDYVLSPCEIQRYMNDLNFTLGNVLNWKALEFQIIGNVLLENKQLGCVY